MVIFALRIPERLYIFVDLDNGQNLTLIPYQKGHDLGTNHDLRAMKRARQLRVALADIGGAIKKKRIAYWQKPIAMRNERICPCKAWANSEYQ